MPIIVFFSAVIYMLYYLGVIQFVISYIARVLTFILGTSPTESLTAAANVFLGMVSFGIYLQYSSIIGYSLFWNIWNIIKRLTMRKLTGSHQLTNVVVAPSITSKGCCQIVLFRCISSYHHYPYPIFIVILWAIGNHIAEKCDGFY